MKEGIALVSEETYDTLVQNFIKLKQELLSEKGTANYCRELVWIRALRLIVVSILFPFSSIIIKLLAFLKWIIFTSIYFFIY